MATRSELWKHFMKIDKNSAKCNRCLKNYKISGNTTNLWSHLEKQHNVKKASPSLPSSSAARGNTSGSAHVGDDQEEDNAVRDEVFAENQDGLNVSTAVEVPLVSSGSGGATSLPATQRKRSSESSESARQKQLRLDESYQRAKSYEDGGTKHAEIMDALLYMISKDRMPYSTTERTGFVRFAKATVPLWSPPSRQTVTRLLEKKFSVLQDITKDFFENLDALCLTADCWTERHATSAFLGMTAHYARGTELESTVLGLERLTQSHTAPYLGDRIINCCNEWNIDRSKVQLIVTDNAENIRLAVKTVFGVEKTQPCFAHTLNLIPAAALGKRRERNTDVENVPGIPSLIQKVKDIVTFSHTSNNFSELFKAAQKARGKSEGTCLRLLQDVVTRWGSTYLMLERFIHLSDIVGGVVCQFPSLNMVSGAELATLKAVMSILGPFHKATEEMSGELYTTASRLIPIVHVLKKKTRSVETPDDLSARFKAFCLSELDRRFQAVEHVNTLAVSTILDPRFKKHYFNNPAAYSNALSCIAQEVKAAITAEANEAARTEQELREAVEARGADASSDDLWGDHDLLVARSIAASTDDISASALPTELKQYLHKPLLGSKANPLEAWETMKKEFPHLYPIARRHLCLLGTSVPIERYFSGAGIIATDQRSRLTGDHLSQLLFLSSVSDRLWEQGTKK